MCGRKSKQFNIFTAFRNSDFSPWYFPNQSYITVSKDLSISVRIGVSISTHSQHAKGIWKWIFYFENWRITANVLGPHCQRNLKGSNHRTVLDLCLKKTLSGKSHDYGHAIVSKKLRFQNLSVHMKTKRFQIPPLFEGHLIFESSVFVTD